MNLKQSYTGEPIQKLNQTDKILSEAKALQPKKEKCLLNRNNFGTMPKVP
jgi:hypothetical protein